VAAEAAQPGCKSGCTLKEMAKSEGAIGYFISSGGPRSHDGTIFAQGGGVTKELILKIFSISQ
jgi:carboxypeptidase Q